MKRTIIKVESTVHAPVQSAWEYWTNPAHIVRWNNPSPGWHTSKAISDLRTGGHFRFRIEAKDGSRSFDVSGVYDKVVLHEYIGYTLADGRKVDITFDSKNHQASITQSFEAEEENPHDVQQAGWQSVLNSFKSYVEAALE